MRRRPTCSPLDIPASAWTTPSRPPSASAPGLSRSRVARLGQARSSGWVTAPRGGTTPERFRSPSGARSVPATSSTECCSPGSSRAGRSTRPSPEPSSAPGCRAEVSTAGAPSRLRQSSMRRWRSPETRSEPAMAVADRLARLARPSHAFAMLALDQRESLRTMLSASRGSPEPVADESLRAFKVAAARALTPGASAVLLDVEYGLWSVRDAGAIAPGCGLIVAADRLTHEPGGPVEWTEVDEDVLADDAIAALADAYKLL